MASKRVTKRKPKQRWKPADIERAAIRYCIEGTVLGTSRLESIPETTIINWKDTGRQEWVDAIESYRDQNNDRFISTANKIIDKATEVTLDKLPEASAQQAATIGAIYYDKQRLALSLPGSYTASGSTVEQLARQFKALASTHTIVPNSTVIEHEKGPIKDGG